jgi:integrase
VKDIDLAAKQIMVRGGKGGRDRVTLLPAALVDDLERQLRHVARLHARDVEFGAGWVELPTSLARKYPGAGRELGWQWVFPASRTYVSREDGRRRRHHLHETAMQKAMRQAVLLAGITKRATCHTLRHHADSGNMSRTSGWAVYSGGWADSSA